MRSSLHTALKTLPLVAACLALPACVKIGAKPPPQLLTIAPKASPQAGQLQSSAGLPVLAVFAPDVPRKLDNLRIAVQASPTSVAYVEKAQWAEAPRQMFRRLLADTIAADGAIYVADGEQSAVLNGRRLSGTLVDFGIDAAPREAVVTFDATLTSAAPGEAMRQRFTARVPVRDIDAKHVAGPISDAANKVAADVAAWVKGS
jgi:cholesterol transport system auxiliary component